MPDTRLTPRERQSIQRRLDRWELGHLRELASGQCLQIEAQATRIADLSLRLAEAEDCAASWSRDWYQLQEELMEQGGTVTLSKDGRLRASRAIHPAAALGARVLL